MRVFLITAACILTIAVLAGCATKVKQAKNGVSADPEVLAAIVAERDREIERLRRHAVEHEGQHDAWLEFITEDCLRSITIAEPVLPDNSINPVYLRADLDGNNIADMAVLVQGQESGFRGVVICRDGKNGALFGELARAEPKRTGFENDAFIIHSWSVVSREKTRDVFVGDGTQRLGNAARGESIGFTHENGNVLIYWDGKALKVAEGF